MPRNPQGLYTLPLPPVVPNTLIETTWANPTMDDIASALTGSLPRDGSAPMTGDLTLKAGNPTEPRHATSKAYVDQFLAYATGMPIGSVVAYASASAPPGFLKCDGQAVSRTTYADLFSAIGTIYGAGDNSTTFNVPDLRDWFIRGKADSRPLGNKMAASLAAHTHPVSDPTHSHGFSATTGGQSANHSHGVSGSTAGAGSHNHVHQAAYHTSILYGSAGSYGNYGGGTPDDGATLLYTSTNGDHAHSFSATTGGESTSHSHAVSGSVAAAATGVSVGATGGAETAPQNIALDYYIKALNDAANITSITGITSSDDNMIAIDSSNPVVPELDIKSNVAYGTVKLDGSGKVPLAQMPAGTTQFMGFYDASTNALPVGVFSSGSYYTISVSGTLNVYDPVTLVSSPTVVQVNSHIQYVESLTNPDGWYYLVVSSDDFVAKTSATGSALLPYGTTAQRDPVPDFGAVRGNVDDTTLEWWNGTAWGPLGGGATGAPNNPFIYENDIHVTASYTITAGKNAMSAGPITVDDGVTVTVPDGSVWSIV